jgi:hypothetical protein
MTEDNLDSLLLNYLQIIHHYHTAHIKHKTQSIETDIIIDLATINDQVNI